MFYPPKGLCKADTEGGPIVFTYLCIIFLGNIGWTFNLPSVFRLFETFKMFYPPKGLCKAEPERGPIVFTNVLFGVGKGTGIFKITTFRWPFWNLENVLSPGGTLRSRARKGSNCFYFTFYPPEGLCASIVPKVVQLFFTYVLSPEGTLQSRYRRRSNCFYLCLNLS